MSETIKYENKLGEKITLDQVMQLKSYFKIIESNGHRWKSIYYENKVVESIYYQPLPTDNLQVFIQESIDNDWEVNIRENVSSIGGFTLFNVLTFKNGLLDEKRLYVENEQGEIILFQSIDVVTNIPQDTEKYYFEDGKLRYEFNYSSNGDLTTIQDTDSMEFGPLQVNEITSSNWNWEGLEYYKAAEPLIPKQ